VSSPRTRPARWRRRHFRRWNSNHSTAFFGIDRGLGEIDMIKDLPPPTEAEEYRNVAEILRDLAAQVRFGKIRDEMLNFADNLDRLAAFAERSSMSRAN
jgi:hypothetical protein